MMQTKGAVETTRGTPKQWFSTFVMKGAKSRPTILSESRTKNFNTSCLAHFVLLQNIVFYTKYQRCYWKTAENRTKGVWGPYAAVGVAVGNHCSKKSLINFFFFHFSYTRFLYILRDCHELCPGAHLPLLELWATWLVFIVNFALP